MAPSEWTEDVVGALIARQREALAALGQTAVPIDSTWASRIDALETEIDEKPEVRIALLGGTGAGKSTLVNALSRERILPVSSMKACTSAITELAHRPEGHSAVVEFIDRDSWHQELDVIAADIRDQLSVAAEQSATEETATIGRANTDKLKAIYGDEQAERFLAHPDVTMLSEPDDVRRAFDERTRTFEHADAAEFGKELKRYLSSDHELWPVVRSVRVEGPFPTLVDGVTIVDLPGLNDPNAAREAATKGHLKDAQFVWVVFNMKRALTREVFEFLREEDLLRRLFMDGRTGTISFIGTAADDIDPDHDIEALGLDEECSDLEIVSARNRRVTEVVREQLDDLVKDMAAAGAASEEEAAGLRQLLHAAPLFCASARDYMQIEGLSRNRSSIIDDPQVTQIPAIVEHMERLAVANGREAQLRSIGLRVMLIGEEMFRAVTSRQAQISFQVEASDRELEEVRGAAAEAQRFLEGELKQVHERLELQLAASSEVLEERLRSSIATAKHSLNQLAAQWRMMHWATLKATVRRDGRWVSSSGFHIDLADQISKPILDGVAFAWVDFFENRAVSIVKDAADATGAIGKGFLDRFARECRNHEAVSGLFDQFGEPVARSTELLVQESVKEAKREIQSRLRDDQRNASERIKSRIAAELAPAFREAAEEEGRGMRDRMVDIVERHAKSSAGTMFDDVQRQVDKLLEDLTAFIAAKSKDLGNKVKAESKNLTKVVESQAAEFSDADALKAELELLEHVARTAERPRRAA